MMKGAGEPPLAIASRNSGNGALCLTSKVRSSIARIASSASAQVWPNGSRLLQRSSEAMQSALRTGSPSWNFRPSRSLIV